MARIATHDMQESHMNVLRRSGGSRMDLWFVDAGTACQVPGVLSPNGQSLNMTIPGNTRCPPHGYFKAQVYTPTGIRALSGFAFRTDPEEIRLLPLGRVEHRERRHSIRVPIDIPISYRLLAFSGYDLSGQGGIGRGRSIDIGTPGMGITTDIRLPLGIRIGVRLDASGWRDFGELECTVHRLEQTLTCWITGLRFDDLAPVFERHLRRFVLDTSRRLRQSR